MVAQVVRQATSTSWGAAANTGQSILQVLRFPLEQQAVEVLGAQAEPTSLLCLQNHLEPAGMARVPIVAAVAVAAVQLVEL
jgi:hypothetical protein